MFSALKEIASPTPTNSFPCIFYKVFMESFQPFWRLRNSREKKTFNVEFVLIKWERRSLKLNCYSLWFWGRRACRLYHVYISDFKQYIYNKLFTSPSHIRLESGRWHVAAVANSLPRPETTGKSVWAEPWIQSGLCNMCGSFLGNIPSRMWLN